MEKISYHRSILKRYTFVFVFFFFFFFLSSTIFHIQDSITYILCVTCNNIHVHIYGGFWAFFFHIFSSTHTTIACVIVIRTVYLCTAKCFHKFAIYLPKLGIVWIVTFQYFVKNRQTSGCYFPTVNLLFKLLLHPMYVQTKQRLKIFNQQFIRGAYKKRIFFFFFTSSYDRLWWFWIMCTIVSTYGEMPGRGRYPAPFCIVIYFYKYWKRECIAVFYCS